MLLLLNVCLLLALIYGIDCRKGPNTMGNTLYSQRHRWEISCLVCNCFSHTGLRTHNTVFVSALSLTPSTVDGLLIFYVALVVFAQ
jgi:hypothetical protein